MGKYRDERRKADKSFKKLTKIYHNGMTGYELLLIQRIEIKEYKLQKLFDWLVLESKVNLYRQPQSIFNQRKFNSIPKTLSRP